MRTATATLLTLATLAAASMPAEAGTATAAEIKGVVLNATCYGPCRYPPEPLPPYTGRGLTVTVRSLPSHRLVAKLHPTDGRFDVGVAPGSYRLRAAVGGQPPCWRGEVKTVQATPAQPTRVRLRVANACIV